MNRFIPAQAETREFAAAIVAYCYDGAQGPAFLAYKGRKAKPSRHHAFATAARRDEGLAFYVEQETRTENERRARRVRRKAGHGLAVGNIFYSSWGCEQTNVDFFQGVRVPSGRSAVVRELVTDLTESVAGSMSGKAAARGRQFDAEVPERLHRATAAHTLNGGKSVRGYLYKWGRQAPPCDLVRVIRACVLAEARPRRMLLIPIPVLSGLPG